MTYAGNINQLILKVDSYVKSLEETQGIIAEFVNPKYKDATKTEFKSSTRLECMMQDYAKALPPTAAVGFTVVNQVSLCNLFLERRHCIEVCLWQCNSFVAQHAGLQQLTEVCHSKPSQSCVSADPFTC